MAKKKQDIQLEGLDDLDFNKEPDIKSAQSVILKKDEPQVSSPKPKPKASVKTPQKNIKANTSKKGTFPPQNKKRATFNIDEDLHKALKDYSYFEEIEMVEYVFNLVKKDLKEKGYYPPKKRRK